MNPSEPPGSLDEWAERLGRRRLGMPSAQLAARVRAGVAVELRSAPPARGRASRFAFIEVMAAAFVIATSLSLIAISDTRGASKPPADPARALATARAIRELAPELSEADALRISVIDDPRSNFPCVPQPRTSGLPSDVRSAQRLMSADEVGGERP